MPAQLLVELLDELPQTPAAELVDLAALAADDADERALATADERYERGEVELPADLDPVGHRLAERDRAPEVVETRDEDGEPLRALARELVLEVVLHAREVRVERLPLLVREVAPTLAFAPLPLLEQ